MSQTTNKTLNLAFMFVLTLTIGLLITSFTYTRLLSFEYIVAHVILVVSCTAYIVARGKYLHKDILFTETVFYFLFLAYVVKFYFFVSNDEFLLARNQIYFGLSSDAELMTQLFTYSALAILAALTTLIYILYSRKPFYKLTAFALNRSASGRSIFTTYVIVATLFIILYVTSDLTQKGRGIYLPYNLNGLLQYCRIIVVPSLLLFLIWQYQSMGAKFQIRIAVVLYLLFLTYDAFSRDSKGSMLYGVTALMFFFYFGGTRIQLRKYIFLGSFFYISVMLYPVLRQMRFGYNQTSSVLDIISSYISTATYSELFFQPILMVFSRVISVGSYALVLSSETNPLYFDVIPYILGNELHNYVTQTYFTYGLAVTNYGASASFFGYLYIVGGLAGLLCLLPVTIYCMYLLWCFCGKKYQPIFPIVAAMYIRLMINDLSDGDLLRAVLFRIPMYMATMSLCILILNIFGSKNAIRNH